MEFRLARRDEIDICSKIVSDSFIGYQYFEIFVEDEEKRREFVHNVLAVGVKASYDIGKLFVGVENDEIITVAQLQGPKDKEPSLLYYVLNGGFKAFKVAGIKETWGWYKMFEETNLVCTKIKEKHWHLQALNVANGYKRKGYGSKMLQECIIPYIKENGGGLVTLITNANKNREFYDKNGFKEFKSEFFTYKGEEMGNWAYEMTIEK